MRTAGTGWLWARELGDVPGAAWDALLRRTASPSPFLSRIFLGAWARAFVPPGALRAGLFLRDGAAGGLLFLYRDEAAGRWSLLGGEEVADVLDAIVPREEAEGFWAAFLRAAAPLLAEGPIVLPNLPEGSPAVALLPSLGAAAGMACAVEETHRAPFVPLPSTFEAYAAALDGKSRHELRRKMRRAEAAVPGLRLRVTASAEELESDLDAFVRLHRASHPAKRTFMDERMASFFGDLARGFFRAGCLRLAFLGVPGTEIAAAFQIEWNESLLLYNSGHDPAWRAVSPGVVLVARCIRDAIARGLREYDFLRGTERYKYDLGGRDRRVFRVTLARP